MMLIALILSVIMGVAFGILYPLGMSLLGFPFSIAEDWWVGLIFGGATFPAVLLLFRFQQKRFKAVEEKLPTPPTHSFSVLLRAGNKRVPMALFLCEDRLFLVDADKTALPMTVYTFGEIISAHIVATGQLEIRLTESRTLLLQTAATEQLLAALKERGCLPFQH